jgi:hypothetical protein
MIEGNESRYEVVATQAELDRKVEGRTTVWPTGCKVYTPSDQGMKEKKRIRLRDWDESEHGNFTVWWQFIYDPEWPRGWKILFERVGYLPVWIDAQDLPANVSDQLLLIEVRKAD